MLSYIVKRLLLMIPTLLGVLLINFLIIQAAPGGPVEQMISEMSGMGASVTAKISGEGSDFSGQSSSLDKGGSGISRKYRGAEGLDPELVKRIEKIYGFDKPPLERFLSMLGRYLRFDLDKSIFHDKTVIQLLIEKLPVSVSLGLWTTLLVYLVSIPLGIRKAVKDGSPFDVWSSGVLIVGHSIPAFLFALLLIILFAGGSFLDVFPSRGLVSDNWASLPWYAQIADYFHHLVLPVLAMVISGFAGLAFLTKNSFIEEIRKQYVTTARAKGLEENKVLYTHVFRNAMLIVIAGFPAAFLSILFTGSLLIEVIFSLDGIGLLGYNAILKRDYPVIFGSLYFFTLLGLLMNLVNDLMYVLIDPRINFNKRDI